MHLPLNILSFEAMAEVAGSNMLCFLIVEIIYLSQHWTIFLFLLKHWSSCVFTSPSIFLWHYSTSFYALLSSKSLAIAYKRIKKAQSTAVWPYWLCLWKSDFSVDFSFWHFRRIQSVAVVTCKMPFWNLWKVWPVWFCFSCSFSKWFYCENVRHHMIIQVNSNTILLTLLSLSLLLRKNNITFDER